jgi:hypothetical protein
MLTFSLWVKSFCLWKKEKSRNEIYSQAVLYGMNTDKTRWIIGFLLEAGLVNETRYLYLQATPIGVRFLSYLPLANKPKKMKEKSKEENNEGVSSREKLNLIIKRLENASQNPLAEEKQLGVALEESIAEIFRFMGFHSERIGGAGNTDVIVRWQNYNGNDVTAIIDGKSKSSGKVSHNDISDIAIDTHKDANNADYVAIIGSNFSGETIRNIARKRGYALINIKQLSAIAVASDSIGLSLQEIGLMFQVPEGISELNNFIMTKQRELKIMSIIITTLNQDQAVLGGLSARDIFIMSRTTTEAPSLSELLEVVEILSKPEIGAIYATNQDHTPETTTYMLRDAKATGNRLRALALIIDESLRN